MSDPFPATRWSLVLTSREPTEEGRRALGDLCQAYWYPLYAYARRRRCSPEEAEDAVQGFYLHVLETDALATVHPRHGRLRAFFLASFKNYLADLRRRERAEKRGGEAVTLSIDAASAEERYLLEPKDHRTPEQIYERRWALILLERTLRRLRKEYSARDQAALFENLQPHLQWGRASRPVAESASAAGLTENAFHQAIHRCRKRYRQLLEIEIADTVGTRDDIEDEMNALIRALSFSS